MIRTKHRPAIEAVNVVTNPIFDELKIHKKLGNIEKAFRSNRLRLYQLYQMMSETAQLTYRRHMLVVISTMGLC